MKLFNNQTIFFSLLKWSVLKCCAENDFWVKCWKSAWKFATSHDESVYHYILICLNFMCLYHYVLYFCKVGLIYCIYCIFLCFSFVSFCLILVCFPQGHEQNEENLVSQVMNKWVCFSAPRQYTIKDITDGTQSDLCPYCTRPKCK